MRAKNAGTWALLGVLAATSSLWGAESARSPEARGPQVGAVAAVPAAALDSAIAALEVPGAAAASAAEAPAAAAAATAAQHVQRTSSSSAAPAPARIARAKALLSSIGQAVRSIRGEPWYQVFDKGLDRAPATLEESLGSGAVQSVLNGDAGKGTWQRLIKEKRWVAPSATIVGFDKATPSYYWGMPDVATERDWKEVSVLTSRDDAAMPKEGSVDLLHLAFMEMQGGTAWKERMEFYQSRVKTGGFALVTHTEAYFAHGDERGPRAVLIEAFRRPWTLAAAYYNRAPPDYPTTEWWDDAAIRGLGRFLLVFQKQQPTPKR